MRRFGAVIGMCAAINFAQYPKTPKPPEPVAVSLYVWNATSQPMEITVSVAGSPLFQQSVATGQGVSRHDAIKVLPGRHHGEATIGGAAYAFEVTVAPDGPRWLVVTWWGQRCDVRLQQQPPWVGGG